MKVAGAERLQNQNWGQGPVECHPLGTFLGAKCTSLPPPRGQTDIRCRGVNGCLAGRWGYYVTGGIGGWKVNGGKSEEKEGRKAKGRSQEKGHGEARAEGEAPSYWGKLGRCWGREEGSPLPCQKTLPSWPLPLANPGAPREACHFTSPHD